jgi:hypothetical protein
MQALRADAVATVLVANGYPDWAVVALAYSALHLVEAFFARIDIHHETHVSRARSVNARLPAVASAHVSLQDLARRVRYGTPLQAAAVSHQLALEQHRAIEAALQPRL